MNAEFELMLACLRWPQEATDGDRIRSLAGQPIRWPYLLQIAHHHKVAPLVFRSLQVYAPGAMPNQTAAAFRSSAVTNAHTALQDIAHLQLFYRRFREQQIDVRVFKGIPLAIAAFQDATLRDAGDIDLLVAEKDMFAAGEILAAEGYVRCEPQARLTPRRLRSYLAHQKDFSYEHPNTGVVVDLHWRLFRNPFLPANAGMAETGENWFNAGSVRIPTLPLTQLLLYLCVHGALDGWLRLKWLADIGALLHTMPREELAFATVEAAKRQALPQFSAAILLCQDLLGPHPSPAGCLDRSDRRVARILRFAKQMMTSNDCRPIRERIPSTQWFLNEFRLHSSWRYHLDLLLRAVFRPRVWQTFDLQDTFFPLYALLSPLEWMVFRLHPRMRAPADIGLAIEAGCMLTFFRIALSFLPVQKLTAWMSKPSRTDPLPESLSSEKAAQTLRRIQWSIDAVVRHFPLTFVCFPQCLAAYFMLRRRHIASKLFYGVTRDANQLKAHTWVKVGDRTVAGGEVESRFTILTTFP